MARSNGIDISGQRARKFLAADFDRYDLILAMAGDVVEDMRRIARDRFDAGKVELLMNLAYPGRNQDVPDPWYGPEPGYHEVYAMISEACETFISETLSKSGKTA